MISSVEHRLLWHADILGLPQGKPRRRSIPIRNKDGVQVGVRPYLPVSEWAEFVKLRAQEYRGPVWEGAVRIVLIFRLPRPQSLPKRVPYWAHTKKPDVWSAGNNIADALAGIVYVRDEQHVQVEVTKVYTSVHFPQVGCEVTVYALEEAKGC